MPLDVSRAPTSASPLWVIALFIALSEATAGVAAITTNGVARLIFACFAVIFPSVVFVVFVWLLVRHAPNLYAPGQYSSEITPEIYRIGISRADSMLLGRAVAESVLPLVGSVAVGEDHAAAVEQVARRFETAVEKSSVLVSVDASVKAGIESLQIQVTEDTQVDWLLDMIYFALQNAVKPKTYNRAWILIDDNGREYSDIGTIWANRQGGLQKDTRRISAVGIVPGSRLTAMAKPEADRHKVVT